MTKQITPKEGSLRVWNVINVPSPANYYPVATPDTAVVLIEALAASQLLDENIDSNAFGLEIFEDGEWSEWHSENDEDIAEYAENKE